MSAPSKPYGVTLQFADRRLAPAEDRTQWVKGSIQSMDDDAEDINRGAAMRFTREIPTYQCHKQVQALKIAHLLANPRGIELHFEDERFGPAEMSAAWIDKHKVMAGGYLVIYDGGYASFSPAEPFEAGYTLVGGGEF